MFSGLEKLIPGVCYGQPIKVNIAEHFTVGALLKELNISEKEVYIILINGVNKGFDERLADGDRLSLFPPVGGG